MSPLNNEKVTPSFESKDTTPANNISVFNEIRYFNNKMYEDYKAGKISNEFEPYFNWKFNSHDINVLKEESAYNMRDQARDLLEIYYESHPEAFSNIEFYHYDPDNYDIEESIWSTYKGFKEDMYMVSYLEKIDEELCELIASGILK